jgi:predicted RNA binding protein YcfA (HicA-like mRNA interferase family)
MGSKYPVLTPDEVIRTLKKFGFYFVSQKGSHMKYSNGQYTTIIPNHSEIAKGTLKSILTLAHIDLEDFLAELDK